MKTQFDWSKRVVSLENLEAMCNHISGVCHRYEVTKVSKNRVYVAYSNPDEYGNESPMIAVFPIYPNSFDDNPCVVMDIITVQYDNWNGEGWQAFDVLLDCPKLWRGPDNYTWKEESK